MDAAIISDLGALATPSVRFQVGACRGIGFKPKLHLRLFGGTKRGDHPSFRTVLVPRENDANIDRLALALPRSQFLDQGHIGTVCTRVQFAVDRCPAASIYGHATVKTPLFAEPLTGAVYLRSSDNLSASLPQALGDWGYVDRIKLTLRRKYRHRGRQRSYFNAACPAPKVFKRTVFPLAEVTFGFEGRRAVSVTVSKSCAVKEPG